jgi:hypothetical protein
MAIQNIFGLFVFSGELQMLDSTGQWYRSSVFTQDDIDFGKIRFKQTVTDGRLRHKTCQKRDSFWMVYPRPQPLYALQAEIP